MTYPVHQQPVLSYYGKQEISSALHIDLLPPSRRLFGQSSPNCCLGTVKAYILDCGRDHDLPGSLVLLYYQQYQKTGDTGPLVPIIEHNQQDVLNLAPLLAKQTEMMYGAA